MPVLKLQSPTGGAAAAILDDPFYALLGAPISLRTSPATIEAFDRVFSTCCGDITKLMVEGHFYALAIDCVPEFAEKLSDRVNALGLYGEAGMRTSRYIFVPGCFPELAARGATELHPAFGGEIKSVDKYMCGQMLYYLHMDMARIFFPAAKGRLPPRNFYTRPPVGFALLAFPHVAYYVAVELVGKAMVSPASEPFFLRSLRHAEAAAALPNIEFRPPEREIDLSLDWKACTEREGRFENSPVAPRVSATLPGSMRSQGRASRVHSPLRPSDSSTIPVETSPSISRKRPRTSPFPQDNSGVVYSDAAASGNESTAAACNSSVATPSVCWARDRAEFLKLVRGDARSAGEFRGMHEVYDLLEVALQASDRPAELLSRATLLYGQHEVLVVMSAVDGVECSDEEVSLVDGPIMRAATRAIAWLANKRIVYTDLRGPNMIKPLAHQGGAVPSYAETEAALLHPPQAWLIDYDDCFVTDVPVVTLGGYEAALTRFVAVRLNPGMTNLPISHTFAELFLQSVDAFPVLRVALREAFEELQGRVPPVLAEPQARSS